MTVIEAINQVDSLKRNSFSQQDKVRWLGILEGMVHTLILSPHGVKEALPGFGEDTPLDRELLITEPFAEVYLRWLEAQMDYHNGEYGRYNNAISLFNTAFAAFADHYHRTHKPENTPNRFF